MLVEIYGMPKCSYCEEAKNLCEELEMPYHYLMIDEHYNVFEFQKLFPQATTFPQILINGIHIGGYSDFEEVLEMASE